MRTQALLFAFIVVAGAGCKKKEGVANQSFKDRATALAAKFGPKLGDLSKKLPDLASHAKDLPAGIPGDKLAKLLEENKSSIAQAQDVLAKLPEKLGKGSAGDDEKAIAEAEKVVAADVATAEQDEKDEAAIEAGPGSGSGSGSAK